MYISITQDTCPFSMILLHNFETHCTNTRHTKNTKIEQKSKKAVNAAELKVQKPFCWLKCKYFTFFKVWTCSATFVTAFFTTSFGSCGYFVVNIFFFLQVGWLTFAHDEFDVVQNFNKLLTFFEPIYELSSDHFTHVNVVGIVGMDKREDIRVITGFNFGF